MSDMKSAAHLSWDELQEIGLSAASKAIDRAAAVTAPSPDVLLAEAAAAAKRVIISSAADQSTPEVARRIPSLAKLLEAREQLNGLLRYIDEEVSAGPDLPAPARRPRRSSTTHKGPTKTQ